MDGITKIFDFETKAFFKSLLISLKNITCASRSSSFTSFLIFSSSSPYPILKVKNPRLITVSRFDKRKNHEKIVMAIRNLKQIYPDIVYICVGYGEEEENIKKLVKELDLEAQVMFFKDISNDLKNALVSKSNIFVMPSIIHKKSVEGFGIAYVEAAQYGIPSIGGKDGGAADAIDHEKTGLICDGNNLDDIYSSINSLLENKKYLNLGKNAKEFVNKFQWSKIIEEYKKILN